MGEITSIYIIDASQMSAILPLLVGSFKMKGFTYQHDQRLLFLFGIVCLFFEVLSYFTYMIGNNLYLLHFYTIIEFSMIASIFSTTILSKRTTIYLIVGFVSFALLNGFFIEGLNHYNANVRAIECITLIFLSLLFFYQTLNNNKARRLEHLPMFWISVAVLLYFSGNFLVFLISEYALVSERMSFTIWGIHALINIIKNILFAIALWVQPTKLNSPSF